MAAGIPSWVYILGPILVLVGGGYAAVLGRKSAKNTNKQITQSDLIDQIQQERDTDKLTITDLSSRVSKLERLARMASKFIYQQDMWITRVYDVTVHPPPPDMPTELREQQ